MTSTVGDILTSAAAIGEGSLVSPASHALQLAPPTAKFPPWNEKMWYGFGVFVIDGWVVQNPSFAGYAATMAYLPEKKLGIVVSTTMQPGGVAGREPLDRPAEGDRRRPGAGGAALSADLRRLGQRSGPGCAATAETGCNRGMRGLAVADGDDITAACRPCAGR